jgi:hypothetical protein
MGVILQMLLQQDFLSICAWLSLVFDNKAERDEMLALEGDEAQQFLDFLQEVCRPFSFFFPAYSLAYSESAQVIDFPELDPAFRAKVVHLLLRLSKKFALHPECLSISGLQLPGKYAVACGAYGDVWKGLLRGEDVSVKVVRLFNRSDIQTLLKVSCPCSTKYSVR